MTWGLPCLGAPIGARITALVLTSAPIPHVSKFLQLRRLHWQVLLYRIAAQHGSSSNLKRGVIGNSSFYLMFRESRVVRSWEACSRERKDEWFNSGLLLSHLLILRP